MNRNICIYQEFLTEAHKDQIRETARRTGFTPHFFNLDQFEEAKDCLQHCEVLYAHSADLLRAAPATLKWYCCSFAGVDLYCKDPGLFANPDCLLTNSNVYGVTIAEHVVMVTLMLLRRMPEYIEIVRGHGWSNQLPVRSIRDNEFTILGTGDIGRHVADRLRGMGAAKIVGLSRSGKPHPAFDEVYPISALDDVLPRTKILVMALPSTPETVHILNRERIALLPADACVINVGRGTALDQKALADLNAITHKYVAQETARRIAAARQAGVPAVGIDAIALLESPLAAYCDRTLAITAPEELRVKRIMAREGISEDYARMRVAAQKPSAWFQAHCDDTLESTETDTVETFAQRARALFQQMLEESK